MYEIKTIKAVKKDIKSLHPKLKDNIKNHHFKKIRESPFGAHELGYAFKGLWSYHFSFEGTEYRIVYEIFEKDKLIVVIMIGKRESFYEKLRRRLI
ncbi:MAG: type II toxin-antitoxin system mRNA interferase toxin, RelE/StbE family [Nitrospirae bacterium]|nr:type II toxin-antitoxin system mRNA interferase toxin, RelE/StbE family [Nitrospirota bacterium]